MLSFIVYVFAHWFYNRMPPVWNKVSLGQKTWECFMPVKCICYLSPGLFCLFHLENWLSKVSASAIICYLTPLLADTLNFLHERHMCNWNSPWTVTHNGEKQQNYLCLAKRLGGKYRRSEWWKHRTIFT